MVSEIGPAIQGAKALISLLDETITAVGKHKRSKEMAELMDKLVAASQLATTLAERNHSLVQENRELKEKVAELQSWAEKELSHEIKEVAPGIFVHVERGAQGPIKSMKKYCTECFENRKRSVLQLETVPQGRRLQLRCPVCGPTPTFRHFSDARLVD